MPPSKAYHFHPQAWAEFETAESWYRQRSADSSLRFLAAVYDALEDISQRPPDMASVLARLQKVGSPAISLLDHLSGKGNPQSRFWQ